MVQLRKSLFKLNKKIQKNSNKKNFEAIRKLKKKDISQKNI